MKELYMDVAHRSVNHAGESICGDSVVVSRPAGGRRILVVLSDGMGSGIKANVLSTLTSSMLSRLLQAGRELSAVAPMVMHSLPVCSVRKISYSTFTVIDMDSASGTVAIAEYGNPSTVVLRAGRSLPLEWAGSEVADHAGRNRIIRMARFTALAGDCLLTVSDGVTQSGQAPAKYRFGWGEKGLLDFVEYIAGGNPDISASDLASQVVSKACANDSMKPSDDITCVAMRIRCPRSMMLISCPPALKDDHPRLAAHIKAFTGQKAICGYHVAEIIASQMNLKIRRDERTDDPSLPPAWHIAGFGHVTDGIVTSNRLLHILESASGPIAGGNQAESLARALVSSDYIEMVIGTMRAHGSEEWRPDEFELRRSILYRIAETLEGKFNKQVVLTYI